MALRADPKRLMETVGHLASYPTRNTLSPGHREACEWLAQQYSAIPGVEASVEEYRLPAGPRVPVEQPAYQVVATLPGDGPEMVLVTSHIDSLNLQVSPLDGPAPGANDNASGVAVGLETMRALAATRHRKTLRVVAFSGEEQGLLGAKDMARRAKEHGWPIAGVFNFDTVGGSQNKVGQRDHGRIRVFSAEGPPRDLARWIARVVAEECEEFRIKLVLRADRFGRGGDHTPFANLGFRAVRFTEVYEEYSRQHTPDDIPEYVVAEYLANVTTANILAVNRLLNAVEPPPSVLIDRTNGPDTILSWEPEPGSVDHVWMRETTSAEWETVVPAESGHFRVVGVSKDDTIFAVGRDGGIPREADLAPA